MVYKSVDEIIDGRILTEKEGEIFINDEQTFREEVVDRLVDTIILTDSSYIKKICYWVVYEASIKLGVIPSSIISLYEAMGRKEISGFTVPAINLRTLTYLIARQIFSVAKKNDIGAFIFEIAKSEIGYTDQRPLEYASMVMLAAIKEGYKGPIFLQGDHFQIKGKNFFADREKELKQLEELIKEAIDAGFYNIDIDSSTLVDLNQPSLDAQQKNNYEVCAYFTKYIRKHQPKNIEITIGGEIGEVGGKNSTPEELRAFMQGYLRNIDNLRGISKISIQTGTTHGGVVLPDGSIAKVNIDFDTLKSLSEIARNEYNMAGAVQHGASTLPNEAFHRFPEVGCAEIHLATQFQNIVYDYLPLPLKEKIYEWLKENFASERKPDQTEDQFIYKTRKNAFKPFKKDIHLIPRDVQYRIGEAMYEEFSFLFDKLNLKGTRQYVEQYVKPSIIKKKKEDFIKEEKDLGELEGAD